MSISVVDFDNADLLATPPPVDDWRDMEPDEFEVRSIFGAIPLPEGTPQIISDIVEDVLDRGHMIEFPDEGDFYLQDFGDDYVPLSYMSVMKYAISNCHSASWGVIESLCLPELDLVGIRYNKTENSSAPLQINCHYAIAVNVEGETEPWVIDFTARQFHKNEQFPLVAPLTDWERKINDHVARLFEQSPLETRIGADGFTA